MAIFVSVAIVEAFLNAWFQTLIRETRHSEHSGKITTDLQNRKSLGYKIHKWPHLVFGAKFETETGAGLEFDKLRTKRNQLMHFASYEIVELPGRNFLMGAANTSVYSSLTVEVARWAYETSVRAIAYLLHLSGSTGDALLGQIHHWLGLVPGTYDISIS